MNASKIFKTALWDRMYDEALVDLFLTHMHRM